MISKIILTPALIATMLATLCVTASELANAGHGELLMKLMAVHVPYVY